MKKFFSILFFILLSLYPVFIFFSLVIFHLPVRVISLALLITASFFFLLFTAKKQSQKQKILQTTLFFVAALSCFFTNNIVFLKLYAVAVSASLLFIFGSTLFFPPTIIFRFATLYDKKIIGSAAESFVRRYCKKATIAWCAFFIVNGSISLWTAFCASNKIWALYNGAVSYALIGLMFAGEFFVRKGVQKKMPKPHTISQFSFNSRDDDFVVCYEKKWSGKIYKTWKDFLTDSAKMRKFIETHDAQKFILHSEDYYYFLCTFVALLQMKKTILLTQNISNEYIAEMKTPDTFFLTDRKIADSFFIPEIIEHGEMPNEDEIYSSPKIISDETKIFMYTSGSTGKPKAILQRMTEFENDNAFVFSKWGCEFEKRKLVTTVSQHHIYGFLFSIALPFGYGIPFRRTRIIAPEEFEALTDDEYMIIASPAFLKRTVSVEKKLPLKNCFIFTSGGAVSEELAHLTKSTFGFCPLEVYGSTETSGIAFRQQTKDGLFWTPFDNAKIRKGADGCLVIASPYIKDKNGFATADLVEIFDNGKFLLKGRSDSVVKIEEKRISLTEVEMRLLQSEFVKDAKVIALEDNVRQYLAAAIELSDAGKAKFANKKKLTLNSFFHDYLMQFFENVVIPKKWRFVEKIPTDTQGKKHKNEIEKLFENE